MFQGLGHGHHCGGDVEILFSHKWSWELKELNIERHGLVDDNFLEKIAIG